ncbi:hypothetical protein NL676_008535 [Syzygium grande]|nr:hypothetical protein NL676_008535 [Syzygium grande]
MAARRERGHDGHSGLPWLNTALGYAWDSRPWPGKRLGNNGHSPRQQPIELGKLSTSKGSGWLLGHSPGRSAMAKHPAGQVAGAGGGDEQKGSKAAMMGERGRTVESRELDGVAGANGIAIGRVSTQSGWLAMVDVCSGWAATSSARRAVSR